MKLCVRWARLTLAGVWLTVFVGEGGARAQAKFSGDQQADGAKRSDDISTATVTGKGNIDVTTVSQCGKLTPRDGKCVGTENTEQVLVAHHIKPKRISAEASSISKLANSPLINVPIPCKEVPPRMEDGVPRCECDLSVDPNLPGYQSVKAITPEEAALRGMRPHIVVTTSWPEAIQTCKMSEDYARRSAAKTLRRLYDE
jgi:hypothetical protein